MKKCRFFMLCAIFIAFNMFSYAQSDIINMVDSLVEINQPRKAADLYGEIASKIDRDKEPMSYISAMLQRYELQRKHKLVSTEAILFSLDSLKKSSVAPYDVVVRVAEVEMYALLAARYRSVAHIDRYEFVPFSEWSSLNYIEKIDTLVSDILVNSESLSKMKGDTFLPFITYNDVPELEYTGLDVVSARLYTFISWLRSAIYIEKINEIKDRIVNILKKYNADQTLFLFQLRDLNAYDELNFQKLLKESEGTKMHYAVKRSHAVALYSKGKIDDVMAIYRSDKRYANDLIMRNLVDIAKMKDLSFVKDGFIEPTPNKAWSCFINSKNNQKINFTLYDLPYTISRTYDNDNVMDGFEKDLKVVRSWSEKIKKDKTFDYRKIEIKIPPLPANGYALKATVEGDSLSVWFFFEVSSMECFNSGGQITVVDRISGEPVVGADFCIYEKRTNRLLKTYVTDSLGGFVISDFIKSKDYRRTPYRGTIVRGDEQRDFSDRFIENGRDVVLKDGENFRRVNFLFDKPIYKPGDTIKYKAIFIERNSFGVNVIANIEQSIHVKYGANNFSEKKKIDDYGAINGRYVIPKDISENDIYFSSDISSSASVRVEQYKAPLIEIAIDKEYLFVSSDSVLIKGRVQTMNRYDVEGAVVFYHFDGETDDKKILTDINGNFAIKVFAPQRFQNTLRLNVTSPSGSNAKHEEWIRCSRDTIFSVKRVPELEINDRDRFPAVKVYENRRKEISQPIIVKIYEDADSLEKSYYQFLKLNDGDKLLYEGSFSDAQSVNKVIREYPFTPGKYKIKYILEADTTCQTLVYQTIFSKESKEAIKSKGLYFFSEENSYRQGDTLDLLLGSSMENVLVFVYKLMFDRTILLTTCRINSSQEVVKVPFTNSDQSNVKIVAVAMKDGQPYVVSKDFSENVDKDQLSVELISFRDRVEVGEEEKLKLRVKNSCGEGVKSQLFVRMYDAALNNIYTRYDLEFNYEYIWNSNQLSLSRSFETNWYMANKNRFVEKHFIPHQLLSLYTPFSFDYDEYMLVNGLYKPFWKERRGVVVAFSSSAVTLRENYVEDVDVSNYAGLPNTSKPQIRTDFSDSGVFITEQETDENGYAEISFIAPQMITAWDFMIFAHTKDVKVGSTKLNIYTYKNLMVSINKPRFMRESDRIILSARVDNITDQDMECDAEILIDDKPIGSKKVNIPAQGHKTLSWEVAPDGVKDFFYCTIKAACGGHIDGERILVPYLSNKVVITETSSVVVDKGERKSLKIKVPKSGRENHLVKLEVIKNPLWLVLENLPVTNGSLELFNCYIFNGIYANTIASHLKSTMPDEVNGMLFDKKKRIRDGGGVLDMNQEVKQIAIENAPWRYYPTTDRENYERLLSFYGKGDLNHFIKDDLALLFRNQLSNGSFAWILNYDYPDRYTSQHIAIGFGRLYANGILNRETFQYSRQIAALVNYLDVQFDKSVKSGTLDYYDIHHLYMRSMHKYIKYDTHNDRLMKCWADQPLYLQALIGMAFHNSGYEEGAKIVLASLKDRATIGKDGERYWETAWGSNWYSRPIETHAAIMEFLNAMGENVDDIKKFMIINKKANSWGYSTATVDACYSMLIGMDKELKSDGEVKVTVAGKVLDIDTNYFTKLFSGDQITPSLNNITIESSSTTAMASLYYQYLEATDKVEKSSNGITVERKLIVGDTIKLGDKIKVRMVITVDRDMEYVHLRDNRSMALEPVDQISSYVYNGSIWFRKVIRNSATDFFIGYLPKGTHVIDYDVIVTYSGDVTAGFAEVQSLYAPEMKSTSKGSRIVIQ